MAVHSISKGLDLPIAGEPDQSVHAAPPVRRVALVADDYVGMKPRMRVQVGDRVKRGQPLFEDRKCAGVLHTAPGAGEVIAIHRGERRALQSVVIELDEAEQADGSLARDEQVDFQSYTGADPAGLDGDAVRALLLESGLWTALRTRPFSRVPAPDAVPDAIFVTAIDSDPLAPFPETAIAGLEEDLALGLRTVAKLTQGTTHFCRAFGSDLLHGFQGPGIEMQDFSGPHPAGVVGTHIHLIEPVHRGRSVWHLGYQDVIAIGRLVRTGELSVARTVALAGPQVSQPRLVRTRMGASIDELVEGQLVPAENRVLSGSVLSGRRAMGDVHGYLGRFDRQVAVIREERERLFLGWLAPMMDRFSSIPIVASRFKGPSRKFALTTTTFGSKRAMVPIGMYERVMPLDLIPTFLLRALAVGDLEWAEQLGCLELDEEDLALCTFVCPGKTEWGPLLRETLDEIHKDG